VLQGAQIWCNIKSIFAVLAERISSQRKNGYTLYLANMDIHYICVCVVRGAHVV